MTFESTARAVRRARHLDRDETLRLWAKGGMVLRAHQGTVLVTREGDAEDHVLNAGEELLVRGKGLVVAWALTPAILSDRDAPEAASDEGSLRGAA